MNNVNDLFDSIFRACGISIDGKSKEDYKEILKLAEMLRKSDIPFKMRELHGGYRIAYPNYEDRICSVVEHSFSYGSADDKLEIMGLLTKEEQAEDVGDESSVKGYLTATDVFGRISKHYADNYKNGRVTA